MVTQAYTHTYVQLMYTYAHVWAYIMYTYSRAPTTTISQIYNTMGVPLPPFPTCLRLNRYRLFGIDQPVFYKDEWLNIGRICHHKWRHGGGARAASQYPVDWHSITTVRRCQPFAVAYSVYATVYCLVQLQLLCFCPTCGYECHAWSKMSSVNVCIYH